MSSDVRSRAGDEIARRIVAGDLAAGTLLDEAALGSELGTDAGVVREALACLVQDGLARDEAGGRFGVTELNEIELREAYPVALLLEGLAVRTMPDADEGTLARLREINAEMEAAAHDPMAAATCDHRFHQELVRNCGNEQLLATLRPLKRMLLRYEYAYMGVEEHVSTSVRQHARIIDALERGDREQAADCVEANFRDTMPMLLERI
jgi:DNA-binding GntR family transcriptional regulator